MVATVMHDGRTGQFLQDGAVIRKYTLVVCPGNAWISKHAILAQNPSSEGSFPFVANCLFACA
jgi:hypothetical protein